MNPQIRLTVVLTHPVQYYSPWFRYIDENHREIDLTVLYATEPTPEQQGVGFGHAFTWDVPLTEGYKCRTVRAARPIDNVHSDSFWGLNVPEITHALDDVRPDILLVPGWHSATQLRVLLACRHRGIPVLYRGDTHLGAAHSGWLAGTWRIKTKALLKLFTAYLSVGVRTSEFFRELGLPDSRVFHSPHCVDNEFFSTSAAPYQTPLGRKEARAAFGLGEDDFVILFVGKLESKKRPLDLIHAVAKLDRNTSLLFVGTGSLEKSCRAEAERIGIRATWAGFVNQKNMGRAYAVADCLVLPSDWGETWGLTVNEALATGLPCLVSHSVGCAPDLIANGETGEVFPLGDVKALSEALVRTRERSRNGYKWEPACRARVEEYSYRNATQGLIEACRAYGLKSKTHKKDQVF